MAVIIISAIFFVFMLLLPIIISVIFLKRDSGEAIDIQQFKVRDPRYFVKSFLRLFEEKWRDYDGSGKIFLSHEESILEADGVTVFPTVCTSIVYAENEEFHSQPGVRFEKEVYAQQNAYFNEPHIVRAACSKKNLYLGKGTQVLRWVDAEGKLIVDRNCDLGISGSSATKIILRDTCTFKRLFAPIILIGQDDLEDVTVLDEDYHNISINTNDIKIFRNIKYVDEDITDKGMLTGTIITKHDIHVLNKIIIKGDIRSDKTITVRDNAVIYGNLFAEGDIYLGQNVRVFGSVFTQESFYAERGVTIGQYNKIKSVIARGKVIFDKGCCVFGYISSESGGECCPHQSINKEKINLVEKSEWQEVLWMKKKWLTTASSFMLIVVLATSLFSAAIHRAVQEREILLEERNHNLKKPLDGDPNGELLDKKPKIITREHIIYEDRVLERYYYDSDNILKGSEILKSVMASLPEGVNKYLMLIPLRISIEDGESKKYSNDIMDAIEETYKLMPSDVVTIDVAHTLFEHKEEYLFFRTDDVWTALGAYYGAKAFSKNTGIDLKELEEYREQRFYDYTGKMRLLSGAEDLGKYSDYVSYYILKEATNQQTITSRKSSNEYITYKSPTIAVSRRGYDIFVGKYYSHTILHGDAKNGKTLMILGDEHSKAYAPWLTPYYKNVLIVNPTFFNGNSKIFWKLFSENEITDFLIIEDIGKIGGSLNMKIHEMMLEP